MNAPSVTPARREHLETFRALLQEAHLPEARFEDQFPGAFAIAAHENRIVAGAGVERHGEYGLLRSVVVSPTEQGNGLGAALVRDRLDWARERRLAAVFLLTLDASAFFSRFGFLPVERSRVPDAIRASTEFSTACPDTARVMVLRLDATPLKGDGT